jgi:hypothetical protein
MTGNLTYCYRRRSPRRKYLPPTSPSRIGPAEQIFTDRIQLPLHPDDRKPHGLPPKKIAKTEAPPCLIFRQRRASRYHYASASLLDLPCFELLIFPSVAVQSFRKPIMISSPPAAFRSSSLFRSSMARARYTFFTLLMRLSSMVEANVRVIKTFHFASSSVAQCARNLIKCIINLNHRTMSANSLLYGRRFYFLTLKYEMALFASMFQ